MGHKSREANREWYKSHPEQTERNAVRRRARRDERRRVIQEAKAGPCVDCKKSYPYYVMDFDHARGEKLFEISRATSLNGPLEAILKEIEKCDLVCANCHRERTYSRRVRADSDNGSTPLLHSGSLGS